MTNLNSHTIANQSKILTKYFKLGSYRAILAATLRIWHFFFTFIPSVVLQEMTKKVHSSIHSSNFSREFSSALRRLRFRKCLASFSSNSISPVKKAAEARSTLFCFTPPPPLSGMVRGHYWSENWLHIYQSNLVDFKSRPYPKQQQVITWLSWCLTYFCLGSISMPLSHLRQQQGSRW